MTEEQIEQAASGAAADISVRIEKVMNAVLGFAPNVLDPEVQEDLRGHVKRIVTENIKKALA